jgi:peptide/nickel transport system permease protein
MAVLILKRILWMIPTLLVISVISFTIIQLPPGDYLTSYIMALQMQGDTVAEDQIASLREEFGLDKPLILQYFQWMWGLLHGNLGKSLEWNKPVNELIGERILLTVIISICALAFTWSIALPIGVYSAARKYSAGDYIFTFVGFLGLSTPGFLLALICMYVQYEFFGVSAGGLFSPEFKNAGWSIAKFADLMAHAWVPVVVIGVQGTAGLIRVMRGNLLDELGKLYVVAARAKGVHPIKLLWKYPVRVAINPLVSTIGWQLPMIFSGSVIVAVVMGLPTTGPLLLASLMTQDMYLAGSMVMILATLTVIGTLISDILLLWIDPRIRYEKVSR